jgi:hypothetical protein
MSPIGWSLTVTLSLMVINQAIMRTERLYKMSAVYYALQTMNAVSAVAIFAFGLPGFEGSRVYSFLIGFVFVFRVVWNYHERVLWMSEERREALADEHQQLVSRIDADDDDDESD